jgi:hypothetical protein
VSADELLESIKHAGGVLELDGDKLRCQLPKDAVHLANRLREHKPEIIDILKTSGGRVANFPRCPRCGSFYLYRQNNIGNFECQSCSLQNIAEGTARSESRRVQ